MKKNLQLTVMLLALIFTATTTSAQVLFEENFEGGDTEWFPTGWVTIDADGDTNNWFYGFDATDANGLMRSASYAGADLTPDNWLITPAVALATENTEFTLTFKVAPRANTPQYRTEHYSVWISVSGTDVADFSEIFQETLLETDEPWVFIEKSVNITEFYGETIHIAFRHHNSVGLDQILLDDVKVEASPANSANLNLLSGALAYPNPFSTEINISNAENVSRVFITNVIGQAVVDMPVNGQKPISTSNLANGIYLVTLQMNNGESVTSKMLKK